MDTKVGLLQGLTGSQIQADASTNAEAVQRNERAPQTGFGGYATGGYVSQKTILCRIAGIKMESFYPFFFQGANQVAETPGNFVNVFSQAAANTVNFGTQLLNSLVGVAANILQVSIVRMPFSEILLQRRYGATATPSNCIYVGVIQ